MPTPEERAEALVSWGSSQPGGPHMVRLQGLLDEPVILGPYLNPDLAKQDAARIRRFLAALIDEARRSQ
jgi:hypothetical protein